MNVSNQDNDSPPHPITEAAPVAPGERPCKSPKHERYAHYRALGASQEQAACRAGFPPRCGAGSRLDKRGDVAARIAWLTRHDDTLFAARRQRVIEELYLTLDFDILQYCEIGEDGDIRAIDWNAVRDSGSSKAVNELRFDKDTGRVVSFKRDDRLNALAQLRDMFGLRAPTRNEHSGPDGGPVDTRSLNLTTVTNEQRATAIVNVLGRALQSNDRGQSDERQG